MATTLRRRSVAADNSCLFAAFAVLCEGATSATEIRIATRRLRAQCAAAVLTDPEPETRAVLLGVDSVQAYADWIVDETHWGGEPEIVILSNIYNVDVALISCETLRETRYPAKEGVGLIFLLYTGQHYDPLTGDGEVETLKFPSDIPADIFDSLCRSGISIAEQHNAEAAKRAAEKRVKRLQCGGCGAILDNSSAFQQHCAAVEHDEDFIYDCEEVEIVVSEGDAMPDSSIDLESPEVVAALSRRLLGTSIAMPRVVLAQAYACSTLCGVELIVGACYANRHSNPHSNRCMPFTTRLRRRPCPSLPRARSR
eukprot:5929503-Pleurochrysis_carterae.AAC.4